MEVGAHHVVDVLDLDTGPAEIGDIGRAQPMKLRPGRTLLVVAEAGIDQDRVVAGFYNEAVKAEEQLAGRRIDQPRADGWLRRHRLRWPFRSPDG
jgi:hypothetical protein